MLRSLMSMLKVLIFDEADQLLDMGFRPAIETMLRWLPPKETRQTLMFSATMPKDVKGIAKIAMRDANSFAFVDTVGAEQSTHQHVTQRVTVTSMENHTAELIRLVQLAMKVDGYKIMVFFTTARLTQFYAELFNAMHVVTLEMHSRKSQSHRTKIAEKFRTQKSVIMFSSDVRQPLNLDIVCGNPSTSTLFGSISRGGSSPRVPHSRRATRGALYGVPVGC